MKKYLIVGLCIVVSSSYGQLLSFNPSGVDSDVDAADLNAATTGDVGGTWAINGTAAGGEGSVYKEYTDSSGDTAMLWDYVQTDGNSLDLSLISAQRFDFAPLEISWDIARTRSNSQVKKISIVGYGADGSTEAFRFDWQLNTTTLSAKGASGAQVMSAAFDSQSGGAYTLNAASMVKMGITLDGTSLTYSAEGLTDVELTVLNNQSSISKISFEVDDAGNGVGFALDNVNVTTSRVTVFEDSFENDALATNSGTGGALSVAASANGATWVDGGALNFSPDNGDNNERATVSSLSSFDLSDGFELTVVYSVSDITTDTAGNRFSFGLVSDTPTFNVDPFGLTSGTRPAGFAAFGLNVTAEDSKQGLTLNAVSVAGQSSFTSSTTAENTMTLLVNAAGDYELVLNGSSVGSGASGLDLSGAFYFAAFSQDDLAAPSISSVSLTAVERATLTADAQSVETYAEIPVEITLTGFDPEGGNLSYSVETQPAHGTLSGATNVWTYTPTNGYWGADSFTFTVNNGEADSAPATVSITIGEDELYEGGEYADAFSNPDDTDLPNVLLIGDSISIGYTVQVRKSLAGKADVFRIPSNGKHSSFGLDNLNSWLTRSPGEWDVIHFNWGLWDLAYRNPDSNTQGSRDKVDGTLTTTLEDYRANMQQIVARMKETDAALMWCATTPVPEGEAGRFVGDDIIYNDVAQEVMTANGVVTNDLHAYALLGLPSIQKAYGDVHFTAEGYVYLGKQVAREIYAILPGVEIEGFNIGSQTDGTELALSWAAVSGVSYCLMATTDLLDEESWAEVSNGITGEGQVTETVTIDLSEDKQFFQVIAELE